MSSPKRSNLAPESPRTGVPTSSSPHGHGHGGVSHMLHRTEQMVMAAEAASGHFPPSAPLAAYNWGTNKIINHFAPPDAIKSPLFQTIMRARTGVIAGAGLALSAFVAWKHLNHKGPSDH